MTDKEKKKKLLKTGIVAGVTSASVLVGSTFDTPHDIFDDRKIRNQAITENYDQDEIDSKENEKDSLKDKLRNLIYKVPVKIRAVVFVPLWFLGYGLIFLSQIFMKAVVTPVGHLIVNFILHNLVLLAIIGICIKMLFPDMPWRKIFNIRIVIAVFIGSIILSLCDIIMPKIWENYELYRSISKFLLGLAVLYVIMRPFIKRKMKNRHRYEIQYDLG